MDAVIDDPNDLPQKEHEPIVNNPAIGSRVRQNTPKIKRGLPGFLNGSRISALPDTGASRNIVSMAYVNEKKLQIEDSPTDFKIGNSKVVRSIGK